MADAPWIGGLCLARGESGKNELFLSSPSVFGPRIGLTVRKSAKETR